MENSTRKHQRYYIFIEWENGTTATDIRQKLVVAEGDKALSLSTIYRWIEAFEHGQQSVKDEARSRRLHDAAVVEQFVNDDRHVTTRKLAEVGISRERINHILRQELGMRKICKKWVPRLLTEEHRQKRVDISRQLLQILESGFRNVITGDETWIHYYTTPNMEANKVWLTAEEDRPQIVRTALNSKKSMFCIFFSVEGVVAKIVVPKGVTVTGSFYADKILPEVFLKYKEMTERSTVRNVMLHHDNAEPHTSKVVTKYLKKENVSVLPDLAPCDFFLFPRIKKNNS